MKHQGRKIIATTALLLAAFQNCSQVDFKSVELASRDALAPLCTEISPEAVRPKLKWDWASQLDLTKEENYPKYMQVMASPVVGDLNGDKKPEVVFISWSAAEQGYSGRGVVRIIDGATGRTLRSIGADDVGPFASTTPLLIDIDGNGKAEIFYAHYTGKKVIALNYDGSTRWIYELTDLGDSGTIVNRRSFSATDINNDGKAEIVIGSHALTEDASGKPVVVWKSASWAGAGQSYAINLNPAKPNELSMVTPVGVFDLAGNLKFSAPTAGYSAADIDSNPGLELVGTGGGRLRIIDGVTGAQRLDLDLAVYNDLTCGGNIGGGPATLGDFDGNKATTEIAVATARYLTIFDGSGNLLAKSQTQDCSSLATGISSFDFNGDGTPEILYGDEEYFRIYSLINGKLEVVHSEINPSGTLNEYPLVADIDGNRTSEILVVSNNYHVGSLYRDAHEVQDQVAAYKITGVRAFEATGQNAWMPTRSLWNSFDYNPAFVTDSLRAVSNTSVDAFTSRMFRRNAQLGMFEKQCVQP